LLRARGAVGVRGQLGVLEEQQVEEQEPHEMSESQSNRECTDSVAEKVFRNFSQNNPHMEQSEQNSPLT